MYRVVQTLFCFIVKGDLIMTCAVTVALGKQKPTSTIASLELSIASS